MLVRILVTGGSRGIGAFIVERFSKDSAQHDITAMSRTKPQARVRWAQVDLSELEAVRMFLKGEDPYNVLILNAAIIGPQMLKASGWEETVRTNYIANIILIMETPMNPGGRILAISSIQAKTGVYGASVYASTKAALEGLVRSAALEHARESVTVNALRLGLIDEGMFRALPDKYKSLYLNRVPLRRPQQPQKLANFVHYLCTAPECDYLTGQVITYDGGYLANWWGNE